MKKKFCNIIAFVLIVGQLSSTAQLHAYSFAQFKHAVKHTWFCYRNPDQCTPEEHEAAKRWVYGVGGVAVAASLAAGAGLWKRYRMNQKKKLRKQ